MEDRKFRYFYSGMNSLPNIYYIYHDGETDSIGNVITNLMLKIHHGLSHKMEHLDDNAISY